jgi:hypothetical protein
MTMLTAKNALILIFVSLHVISGCKARTNMTASPISENTDTPQGSIKTSDSSGQVTALTQVVLTDAITCSSGAASCVGNGFGLGCNLFNVLGLCAKTENGDCQCLNAPIPPRVKAATCSSNSEIVCSGVPIGGGCVFNNSAVGFCVPSDAASNSCGCAVYQPLAIPADKAQSEPVGPRCNNYSTASCWNQFVGDACMNPASANLGACLPTDEYNNCDCVDSSLRPNLNGGSCDGYGEDGCLTVPVGVPCKTYLGTPGVCAFTNSFEGHCGCAASNFRYPETEPNICRNSRDDSSLHSCIDRPFGSRCAKNGLEGFCLAVPPGVCGCETAATMVPAPAPAPINITATTVTSNSLTISWTSGGRATVGYKVAFGLQDQPLDCAKGVDLGKSNSYEVKGLTPATAYTLAVCAYNTKQQVSTPANASFLTYFAPDAVNYCGTIYNDANYKNSSYALNMKQPDPPVASDWMIELPKLGGFNDQISSVKVKPGCRLYLYETATYLGRAVEYLSDTANLGNTGKFNDIASSLRCICPSTYKVGDLSPKYPPDGAYFGEFKATTDNPTYTFGASTLNSVRPWIGRGIANNPVGNTKNVRTSQLFQFQNLVVGRDYFVRIFPGFVSDSRTTWTASAPSASASVTRGATWTAPVTGRQTTASPWVIRFTAKATSVTVTVGNAVTSGANFMYIDYIDTTNP